MHTVYIRTRSCFFMSLLWRSSKLISCCKCLLHIGIMNQEMTSEKQLISFYCCVWSLDIVHCKQSRPGWVLFPEQKLCAAKVVQNYEMMITKTVMSLTFRNEDNRNSLWLCRYFGLSCTVNALPNVPEFTGSAD